MADVTRRMLALLALLQTGRCFTGEDLARRLDTSARTVRRDVDRLREYGYPVHTQPGPGGHYRLAAGTTVPPLMVDDEEAVAILLALAAATSADAAAGVSGTVTEASARAYGKLEQILPARLRPAVVGLREGIEANALPAPGTGVGDIALLAQAIHAHRQVELDYHGRHSGTHRVVEPHRQVHHLQRWYLVAWDTGKADWRVFRTDRMSSLRERTATFTPRELPTATALEYVQQGINRTATRVELSVDATPSEVAAALPYVALEAREEASGRTRVRFHVDDWHWLLAHLSRLDAPTIIREPQAWAQEIGACAERLRAVSDDSEHDG